MNTCIYDQFEECCGGCKNCPRSIPDADDQIYEMEDNYETV